MLKKAVFPGSFDPITIGHYSIIKRASGMFDELIVAIGSNSDKQPLFTLEKRIELLKIVANDFQNVRVEVFDGLTVDFCENIGAQYIIRGLRTMADFDFEKNIAQMNQSIKPTIESVFLMCDPSHTAISSSIVRDIYKHGGDIKSYIPQSIYLKLIN